jgi:putative membrane protein
LYRITLLDAVPDPKFDDWRLTMNNLWQSIAGFPNFLLYFALALLLLAVFVAIYVRVTQYREFALIRNGNVAAAISLSGALIGFVLPLASAIAHSVSPVDMVAWGAIALIVQLVVYAAACRLVPHFREAIESGHAAPAALLAALAVSVGVLNAACLTY